MPKMNHRDPFELFRDKQYLVFVFQMTLILDVLTEAFRSNLAALTFILSVIENLWCFTVNAVNFLLFLLQLTLIGIQKLTEVVNTSCSLASELLIKNPASLAEFIIDVTTQKIPGFVRFIHTISTFVFGVISSCFTLTNDLCILCVEVFISLGCAFDQSLRSGSLGLYLCLAIVGMAFTCTVLEMFIKLLKRYPMLKWRNRSEAGRNSSPTRRSFTNNNYEKSTICCICLTEERSIVILPCTHFCLCSQCSSMLSDDIDVHPQCPICRQQIREFMPIINS